MSTLLSVTSFTYRIKSLTRGVKMKVIAIKSIESIFQKLKEDSSFHQIPRENLEKMFDAKKLSDKEYQTWNILLKTKNFDDIKELMIADNELGEQLRNTSIFTRIY